MKKLEGIKKRKRTSVRLLCSYLAIISAPTVAIIVVYLTMQGALLDIQKERAQNLSNEAAVTFTKEMEQLTNVAKYITYGKDLKSYMEKRELGISPKAYYQAYELAKCYPEYALLNRFVKNIYILPLQTSYLMQVPRVIPNNERGMDMTDMFTGGAEYEDMVRSLYELGWTGIFYGAGEGMQDSFLIVQRFDYSEDGELAGVVAIEVEQKELKNLFSQVLEADVGMTFLTDSSGRVLYVCDSFNQVYTAPSYRVSWEGYVREKGWSGGTVYTELAVTGVNDWCVVTALPKRELLARIGTGKTVVMLLCVVSVLIGVAICLWYWNSNQPVVERYQDYAEKYPDQLLSQKESFNIWKNFGGVFTHMENMQVELDRHKQWMQEGIIRKILYGGYDSKQELENELKRAEVDFPVDFPCVLAGLEIESTVKAETGLDTETFEASLREELDGELPYPYLMIRINPLSYVLILHAKGKPLDGTGLKKLFESINYTLYSQNPVHIFTGISGMAKTAMDIAEEYEHVCRCCEYARYYKLRVPCLAEELPLEQPTVFTVEMEIQMEKTIKNGTREQLEAVLAQIGENYLWGGDFSTNYNLELLRGILIRTLSDQEKDIREFFMQEIHAARTLREMERCIWHVWQHFEDRRLLCQDQDLGIMKAQIEKNMEQGYSSAEFNLAVMAEWMDIPEKKLYRDFKKIYGISFTSYLEMKRTQYAQELLKANRPVGEVAREVGYTSDYSFRRAFKRVVGVTPSDYQKMKEKL